MYAWQAMGQLGRSRDKTAQRLREKELNSIKVRKEDIEVITKEIEVDKKLAERRLRECGGDLEQALQSFIDV